MTFKIKFTKDSLQDYEKLDNSQKSTFVSRCSKLSNQGCRQASNCEESWLIVAS